MMSYFIIKKLIHYKIIRGVLKKYIFLQKNYNKNHQLCQIYVSLH